MDRENWNALVRKHPPLFGAFLQSFAWGQFQERLGFQVRRFHEQDEAGRVGFGQAIRLPLPFDFAYWYLPKGPLGDMDATALYDIARKTFSNEAFLTVEGGLPVFSGKKVHDRQPAVTTVLDLTKSYESLLAGMKSKTRYNVRLAEKKGVTIKVGGVELFTEFAELMKVTAERDGFSIHELQRYKTMLEVVNDEDIQSYLAIAFYNDKPLAANLMIDAFDTRTYLHGASSNDERQVMAPYALHAYLIRDAQEKGMRTYDFWGVAPTDDDEKHAWHGITRFKMGFGGDRLIMPGTYEIPIQRFAYFLYRTAKKLRP
ncbi:peptidoglycan bridge formation glycyltransferase FemA/FemB family protein [Patescibacteria group bacterium]|nr:peptidoglycan bridge formation glycyltransferase FemA/FemB family protein [Patescibacteria group bacterium]